MPYEVTWRQEKRILFQRFYGDIDLEMSAALSERMWRLLDEGVAPVHLIADTSEMGKFPTNIAKLHHIASFLSHPSLGWSVLIGASSRVNFMVTAVGHMTSLRMVHRTTMIDAIEFLRTQDSTLIAER